MRTSSALCFAALFFLATILLAGESHAVRLL
jgi:hypothetical protein